MRWLASLFAVALAGCATVLPRFEPDVQAAVVRDEMRVLETAQLVLYYPAPRQAEARRVAARLEACVAALEAQAPVGNGLARARYHVVLPEVPFNNAYVFPKALGIEDVAVIPTGDTLDFVTEFGLPPDPGMTGCHELTHYVHLRQIAGLLARARHGVRRRRARPRAASIRGSSRGWPPTTRRGSCPASAGRAGRCSPACSTPPTPAVAACAAIRCRSTGAWRRPATSTWSARCSSAGWLDTYGEPALWRLIGAQATSASIVLGRRRSLRRGLRQGHRRAAGRVPAPRGAGGSRVRARARPIEVMRPAPRHRRALGDRARRHHRDRRSRRRSPGHAGGAWARRRGARSRDPGRGRCRRAPLAIADALTTTGLGFTADGRSCT
jgi:hypothetical protein